MELVKDIYTKIFLTLFYLFTVFFHRKVNEFVDIFYKKYSFDTTNRFFIYSLILPILIAIVLVFYKFIKNNINRVISLVLILIPMAFYYWLLFVSNVEVIHYVQYSFISYLMMRITDGIWYSFTGSFILGFFDEWYQYYVLYEGEKGIYLDYNDMILNLHGALIGILIFLIINRRIFYSEFSKGSEIT